MSSKSVAIIGMTGTGKTSYIKNNFIKKNTIVFDVNNEYGFPYEKMEDFLKRIKDVKNSILIFEESTIFFSNRSYNALLIEMLVRKRHTNNFIVLVFHSLRSIPVYILNLLDYVVLFKTNDTEKNVIQKFDNEDFTNSFLEISESENKYINLIIKLN